MKLLRFKPKKSKYQLYNEKLAEQIRKELRAEHPELFA